MKISIYILTLLFSSIGSAELSFPMRGKVKKVTTSQIHLIVENKSFRLNKKKLPKHMVKKMSKGTLSRKIYHVPLRSIASIKAIKTKSKESQEKKK